MKKDPAYLPIDKAIDLKANPPEVNVNIPRFLLNDALTGLDETNFLKEAGIDLQDLFKDVKLIRVGDHRGQQKQPPGLRVGSQNASEGTRRQVDAHCANGRRCERLRAGETRKANPPPDCALLMNDGDIIIANVVGHVPLAKILNIASKNNKGMLKTLNKTLKTMTSDEELETLNKTIKPLLSNTEQPAANKPKSTGSAPTNHPAAKEPASKP